MCIILQRSMTMKRIKYYPHSIAENIGGMDVEYDIFIVRHVDGRCYGFLDPGKGWEESRVKSRSGYPVFKTVINPNKEEAKKDILQQAREFMHGLVRKKLHKELDQRIDDKR